MRKPPVEYRCGNTDPCRQPAWKEQKCRYHYHSNYPTFRHDTYYHRKILAGIIQPTWGFFTKHELSGMFDARTHGDGRRLDQYRRR